MTSELWAVARSSRVRDAIAACRADPAACATVAPDFAATYATFANRESPGYWNGYLTWVLVQALAMERYPHLAYSIRNAAGLIRQFLDEPAEEPARRGPFGLLRSHPRPVAASVPDVIALLDLLITLGGEAAEARLALLTPETDPAWSEEGALFFSDAERDAILAALPALRRVLIDPPHGPRFHFWVVRRPGLARATRDILRAPEQFIADLETIFTHARHTDAQVFVLWAP
ncbi:MAG: hypothetical protein ACR2JW_05550 [Thermomicrobiales bacterium]